MLGKVSLFGLPIYFFSFLFAYGQVDFTVEGDKLFAEEKYYEAVKYYERSLTANPRQINVLVQLAKCHLLVSPRTKSLTYIKLAIEYSDKPTNEMYYILGRAYHVNNDFEMAIQHYRESYLDKEHEAKVAKAIHECEFAKQYFSMPVNVTILNAGSTINTEHQEYLPYITADHLLLFFTAVKPDYIGGESLEHQHEDIYCSSSSSGNWSSPSKIHSLNEQNGHDACVGISEDGQTMFVYKGTNGGDLYTSELEGSDWSAIKAFPYNTSGFEGAASLSPDGLTLYYIHSPGQGKDRDIYTCTRSIDGKWSKPEPLKSLNTEYDEESPFIHPDGKTLYFSSKGHSSMGGFDIFKTVKQQDGSWSHPVNLGYPINSTADDVYFIVSADGTVGFYSSDKDGGYGKQDIYILKMAQTDGSSLELLKGELVNENGNPLEASILVTDNETNKLVGKYHSNKENGKFLIVLPCGKNYGIHIEKDGYIFQSENAQLECNSGYKEVDKRIVLSSIHSGTKIVLNNIFFDSGKSELKHESTTELQKLITFLKKNASLTIEIAGYTDNTGEEPSNQLLSQQRAQEVMNYLVKHGVAKTRIIAKGYGSQQPVSSNDTEEGKRLNRRTEFKIL